MNTKYITFSSIFKSLTLAVLILLSSCSSDKDSAEEYLQSAREFYAEKQYSLATVELKNAIRLDSSLAEAYFLQAKIYGEQKDWESMFNFLSTTLVHNPNHIAANIEIAKLFAKSGNTEAARKYVDLAAKNGANTPQLSLPKSLILLQEGKYQEAEEQASAALETDTNSTEAGLILSEILIKQGKLTEAMQVAANLTDTEARLILSARINTLLSKFNIAEQYAAELVQFNSKNLDHYYLLAALQDRRGNINEAEHTLRQAVESNPDSESAKIALAGYIDGKRETARAIDTLSTFVDISQPGVNSQVKLILGELYQKQNQTKQAGDIYEKLSTSNSQYALTAKNKLALLALKQNRIDDALNILNDLLIEEFHNHEALVTRGLIYLKTNALDLAITDLLNALRNHPDSELGLLFISEAYHRKQEDEQALTSLRHLLKLQPDNLNALLLLSSILATTDNHEEAIQNFERYREHNKTSSELNKQLLELYIASKHWNKARALSEEIAERQNQPDLPIFINARILKQNKQFDDSNSVFNSLIEKNRYVGESLTHIVENHTITNATKESIDYLKTFLINHPQDLYATSLLAKQYSIAGTPDIAEQLLLKTLQDNPNWSAGALQLAKLYSSSESWEKALNYGNKTLEDKKFQNSLQAHLLVAVSNANLNNINAAIKHYSKVLDLNPALDGAANNLALLLAHDLSNPENLQSALATAKRFEDSTIPAYLDTLGWIYHLNGDNTLAATYLEKAVYNANKDPVIHFHLGKILFDLGELQNARKHLLIATDSNNRFKELPHYQEAARLLSQIPPEKK